MFKIFYKSIAVICIACVLSLGVDYVYRQTYALPYKFPQNILPHPEIAEKYTLVKLGNSHSEEGLTFEKYNIKSLSLASVAQTYEYDLALLKMYKKQIAEGAVIIINVSPISFSQKKPEGKKNEKPHYYDGRLSPFLIPHMNISDYLQMQIAPFIRSGYLWRTTYAKDSKDKSMKGYAASLPNTPSSEQVAIAPIITPTPEFYIRSEVPTFNVDEINAELNAPAEPSSDQLVESMKFMVKKWNNTEEFDTASFEPNRKDLQAIIDYSLEQKWRPVLVTLPYNQVLLDGLGKEYIKTYIIRNLGSINTRNTTYINFMVSTKLTKNRYLYSNTDHLNPKGAAIVSYLLLQKLIDMKYLTKEVDGYDYTTKEILPYASK